MAKGKKEVGEKKSTYGSGQNTQSIKVMGDKHEDLSSGIGISEMFVTLPQGVTEIGRSLELTALGSVRDAVPNNKAENAVLSEVT